MSIPDVEGRDVARDHVLKDRWTFDEEVADVFDDMLERSIPDYVEMRRITTSVARTFLSQLPRIIDLGASRGEALARLLTGTRHAQAIAVEVSEPMAGACRARFGGYLGVEVLPIDLRHDYPVLADVDVVLSILTLQFVPIEYRQRILFDVWRSLRPGGALVIVEKVLGHSAIGDALLVDAYLDRKRENGYSNEEIDRKRFALEGVLVPVTAAMNESMIAGAGFGLIERIWQSLNFAAWVAIR